MPSRALALLLVLAAAPAAAETRVDWAAGTLTVTAVGIADLRAPSTEIARIGAERAATARATEELRRAARELPLAGGGTLGDAADADKDLAAKLAAVVDAVKPDLDRQSDGSVRLRASLPLARLHALVLGVSPPEADAGEPLVVDARKLKI